VAPPAGSVSLSSCLCDSVSTALLILQPSYQLIPLPSSHPTSSPSWRSFPRSTVLDSMHSRTWWSLCSSYPICCFGPILKLMHMMCDHPAILVSWSSFPATNLWQYSMIVSGSSILSGSKIERCSLVETFMITIEVTWRHEEMTARSYEHTQYSLPQFPLLLHAYHLH